jgi:hypothetical protein
VETGLVVPDLEEDCSEHGGGAELQGALSAGWDGLAHPQALGVHVGVADGFDQPGPPPLQAGHRDLRTGWQRRPDLL